MKFPRLIEVSLQYNWLEKPVVYVFPRLRKRDSELDEQERMLGQGKVLPANARLAGLVVDVLGLESHGMRSRALDESEAEWKARVSEFFSTEETLELAEDALNMRLNAVFPRFTFRHSETDSVAEYLRGKKDGAGGTDVPLPNVRAATEGPS